MPSLFWDYRFNNAIVIYDSVQNYINMLGNKVINNWPLSVRNFNYEFYVVNNNIPNAVAIPGGKIYFHSGLFDLAQSEKEIETVIAHEIAHIEMRHSYRTLLKQKKDDFFVKLLLLGLGATVALTTEDADLTEATIKLMSTITEITKDISLYGYNREFEIESDELSYLYLNKLYPNEENIEKLNILKKMKYYNNEYEAKFNSDEYDTHPTTINRIQNLELNKYHQLDNTVNIIGEDLLNRKVANIKIEFITVKPILANMITGDTYKIGYKYTIYASVFSTEYLYDVREIKDLKVTVNDIEFLFFIKEDTPMAPLSQTSCVFMCESKYGNLIEDLNNQDNNISYTPSLKPCKKWYLSD